MRLSCCGGMIHVSLTALKRRCTAGTPIFYLHYQAGAGTDFALLFSEVGCQSVGRRLTEALWLVYYLGTLHKILFLPCFDYDREN